MDPLKVGMAVGFVGGFVFLMGHHIWFLRKQRAKHGN